MDNPVSSVSTSHSTHDQQAPTFQAEAEQNADINKSNPKKNKRNKRGATKYILAAVFLLLLVVGAGAAYFLTQQNQDVRQQAYDAPGCSHTGGECGNDNDCCGDLNCFHGLCFTGECKVNGESCSVDSDCCGGNCTNGICNEGGCKANGESCSGGLQCCSAYCDMSTNKCADAPFVCRDNGNYCDDNAQCCSSYCNSSNECADVPNDPYQCMVEANGPVTDKPECSEDKENCHCQNGDICDGTKCEKNIREMCENDPNRYWCRNYKGYAMTCCAPGYSCCSNTYGCCPIDNPTPPPSERPTPPPETPTPPPGPQCLDIGITGGNPQEIGDQVSFICGKVAGVDHYIFRAKLPDGSIVPLAATGRQSAPLTIESYGRYYVQCQVCSGPSDDSCDPWENISGGYGQ